MRKIFIALVALVVLCGGGGGAYFYFAKPAEASVNEDAADQLKKDDHAKKEKSAHTTFVELDPLILPIMDNNGISQILSLVIALEVPDEHTKGEVEAMAPKLKDAFIQDMYGILNEHAALKGGVIQVGTLKKRLSKVSQNIMGEDKISDVLLQVIQQRPI